MAGRFRKKNGAALLIEKAVAEAQHRCEEHVAWRRAMERSTMIMGKSTISTGSLKQ